MYGQKLNEIRKKLKLSQEEIAIQTGISYRAYSSYERGERNPSLDFLKTVENLYNINLNWLLADDGEMFNTNVTLSDKAQDELEKIVMQILKKNNIVK